MNNSKIISRFFALTFACLLVMLLDSLSLLNWLRASLEIISRPQIRVNQFVSSRILDTSRFFQFIFSGPAKIADLERRLAETEQKNINSRAQVLGAENNEVGTSAQVLSRMPNLIIANHNFSSGDVVISAAGALVGVVETPGKWSARVRTVSDSGSQFQVKIVAQGQDLGTGIITGRFGGDTVVEKVLTQIQLEPGQAVVTTGADGNTPPNLLVGWIGKEIVKEESSIYQQVRIEPAAKVNDLEMVLVIKK